MLDIDGYFKIDTKKATQKPTAINKEPCKAENTRPQLLNLIIFSAIIFANINPVPKLITLIITAIS